MKLGVKFNLNIRRWSPGRIVFQVVWGNFDSLFNYRRTSCMYFNFRYNEDLSWILQAKFTYELILAISSNHVDPSNRKQYVVGMYREYGTDWRYPWYWVVMSVMIPILWYLCRSQSLSQCRSWSQRVRPGWAGDPSTTGCTFGNVLICYCHLGKLLLWVWWLNFSKLVQPKVEISLPNYNTNHKTLGKVNG